MFECMYTFVYGNMYVGPNLIYECMYVYIINAFMHACMLL